LDHIYSCDDLIDYFLVAMDLSCGFSIAVAVAVAVVIFFATRLLPQAQV
jgi:hypothetical protein